MKLVALVTTLDEVELIGPSINHLRRIGVDLIIVTDYGSVDGTLDVLATEEKHGDLWLLKRTGVDHDTDPLRSERYVALARSSGADWVLLLDTDDFVLPAGGSLRNLPELAVSDILEMESYDVVLSRQHGYPDPSVITPEFYGSIWLHTHGPEMDKWPKIMVRSAAMAGTVYGDHAVVPTPGRKWRQVAANDVLVAHWAFTTPERFERKVANIRRAYARTPEWFAKGFASHWMEWLRMANAGRTGEAFAERLIDDDALDSMRAAGTVRSAADILLKRRHERIGGR